jgi:hypothetical protein
MSPFFIPVADVDAAFSRAGNALPAADFGRENDISRRTGQCGIRMHVGATQHSLLRYET